MRPGAEVSRRTPRFDLVSSFIAFLSAPLRKLGYEIWAKPPSTKSSTPAT